MAIDIGAPAIDRNKRFSKNATYIEGSNPANATGTIDTVEIWAHSSLENCEVGTFYLLTGATYKCRDSVVIGDVVAGSKQTFPSLSLSVVVGDLIGCYFTSGQIKVTNVGGVTVWSVAGEHIDPDDEATYATNPNYIMSLLGTGVESGGPTPNAFNKVFYTSEPPTPSAWNQVKQEVGSGYKKLEYS